MTRENHSEAWHKLLLGGPAVLSLRSFGKQAVEMLIVSLFVNLIALAMPIFSMVVYNKVIGNNVPETLWALSAGAALFVVIELVMRCVRAFYVEHVGIRWDVLFDTRLASAVVRAPLDRLPDMGVVVNRYREAAANRDFLSSSYLMTLADLPFLPIYLVAVILIGGWLVCVPLLLGALLYVVLRFTYDVAQAYHRASVPLSSAKISGLSEAVMAGEVLRHMPVAARLMKKLAACSEQSSQIQARGRYWHALGSNAAGMISSLASVLTVLVGVYLVEAQAMSMGGLIACSSLVARLLGAVHSLVATRARYHDFQEALEKLAHDIPGATDPLTDDEADSLSGHRPARFEGLGEGAPRLALDLNTYRYAQNARMVLQEVCFTIEPGERVALLGRSGSGKSTLLRVLAGLIVPAEGRLMADNMLVVEASSAILRERVAIKSQEPQLINGTLAENVIGGAEDVDAQAVIDILRAVGLGTALRQGELALNTDVGPFGSRLSGGQRQVVALARALFMKRPILILDEPTLGLDQMSQQAVIKAIESMPRSTTVIVATHSAEVLSILDRVIVIDGGRKVADGPRDQVLVSPQQRPGGPVVVS